MVMGVKLRIRDIREDRDISQGDIAQLLLCDQSLYSKYELGKRDLPLRLAVKLAEYYGVTLDQLVGRAPLPENPDKGA